MFGIIPFNFRFRGKVRRILDIYYCFIEQIHSHTAIFL